MVTVSELAKLSTEPIVIRENMEDSGDAKYIIKCYEYSEEPYATMTEKEIPEQLRKREVKYFYPTQSDEDYDFMVIEVVI
jgi:hypothetical protein